jgi:predicted DNA-binding protein (MmcQ/YjbR family)
MCGRIGWVASRNRAARVASWCLSLPGAAEDYPFGDEVAVFKAAGKMFALLLDSDPAKLTLKCDPNRAVALRERYRAIVPGYHSNKRHWNTIDLDGSVPEDELFELVDHSYELVVSGLTKAQRDELGPSAGRP